MQHQAGDGRRDYRRWQHGEMNGITISLADVVAHTHGIIVRIGIIQILNRESPIICAGRFRRRFSAIDRRAVVNQRRSLVTLHAGRRNSSAIEVAL